MSDYENLQYLKYLRQRAGFRTKQAAADYFEVSLRTWRRWENGNIAKRTVYELLKIRVGYFPFKGWEQFYFKNDVLYTPSNRPIYAQELENLTFMFDCVANDNDYKREALKTIHDLRLVHHI